MKFRNKTDRDLILGGPEGRLVKAGEVVETTAPIENPNFEAVEETANPLPARVLPATPPVAQLPEGPK